MSDPFDPADMRQIAVPLADLRETPDSTRLRQLLMGDRVVLLGDAGDGWVAIRSEKDGYRGLVRRETLGNLREPTHRVIAPATHVYSEPAIRARDLAMLSFGSTLTITDQQERFSETRDGRFVPTRHLAPVRARFQDPAGVAELFLGTPYLWGGNSSAGIDCSGLVQAACLACGIACPGDSGDQQDQVGTAPPDGSQLQRGDLLFWRGHVAMAVDDRTLIHANSHHMAVVFEPSDTAIARIKAAGEGDVLAHRRPE